MSVRENLTFGLKMNGINTAGYDKRVSSVLDLVGLASVESAHPDELSGGQQQRVALARALILKPDVLLLDEPLSNLDKKLRDRMQVELKRIQRETGVTAIHVTHNQEEALSLADRICVMNDGSVEQIGPPEEVYYRPANRFVADFLGDSNLLPVSVDRTDTNGVQLGVQETSVTFQAEEGIAEGSTLFFRPEHVTVSEQPPTNDGPNVFETTVQSQLFTGDKIKYELELTNDASGGPVLTAYSQKKLVVDETVWIQVPRTEVRLL
jgi:ABC-type Fe3+/spermidine/putrescine transport system ATPase subunit